MSKKQVQTYGTISEMSRSFKGSVDVPLANGIDLDELTDGDSDPMFVTIDALTDTISGNQRRWTVQELYSVAEQVMQKKPDGYQGHLKQEDRSSKAPDAVTLWLGAKVEEYEGKSRLFIKGYVLPKAEQFKDYLRKAKAAGKNVAVSVYGQAIETYNETVNAFDISQFELESIDWARSGSEGVKNAGYLQLTAEMNGDEDVNRQEVLKTVTVAEMQAEAPSVVAEITEKAQTELKSTISEMATSLGVEEADLPKVVSEMKTRNSELETSVAHNQVDVALGSKVTNVAARGALRKMIIGEMTDTDAKTVQETIDRVLKTDEAMALVNAFGAPVVTPGAGDNRDVPTKSRFIKK